MVGIVDVGSNTVRLLVAGVAGGIVDPLLEERAHLGLGADVERTGRIPKAKLRRAADIARRFSRTAREHGVDAVEVIVTSPGRRSDNAPALVAALAAATGWPVRILEADEEGRLAFDGAVARATDLEGSVGVCDVGGGSTELLVGTAASGPAWCRSFEIGSIRLMERVGGSDPLEKRIVSQLRREAERAFVGVTLPLPHSALATGGSARALRKLVGRTLGEDELAKAVRMLRARPSASVSRVFGLDPLRARTLVAGAVILAEAQRHLGVPLVVARGGLREGAALGLAAERAAA